MTNFINTAGFTYDCGFPYAYIFTVNKEYIYKHYGRKWIASLAKVLSDVYIDIERLLGYRDSVEYGLALKALHSELCRGCLSSCIHITVRDEENYIDDNFEYIPILDEMESSDPDMLLFKVDTNFFYRRYGEDWNNSRFFSDFKHEQDGLPEYPTRSALKYILAARRLRKCRYS